jgi:hypothetical protein
MTQRRGEMMVDRLWGMLGRVDDGVSPGQGYRDFVSHFGIPVSKFPFTHRDELIDEVSDVRRNGVRLTHCHFLLRAQRAIICRG